MKVHLSVVSDILITKKHRSVSVQAKIKVLEAEKTSAVKRKYRKACEEVIEIADALVEDAEENNIPKEQEKRSISSHRSSS